MKQKTTLFVLMLLISVFTFGQNNLTKRLDKISKAEFRSRTIADRIAKTNQRPTLRSVNAQKQQLDSIIGLKWDIGSGQWKNHVKNKYTYDANGNMTLGIVIEWNSLTSQWVNYSKDEYTYDGNGNPTNRITRNWFSATSEWINYYNEESSYDINGNMILLIAKDWNSGSSQWENSYKYESTYDINGKLTRLTYSFWDNGTSQWIIINKDEYTYDIDGNMTLNITYDWNSGTSQWDFFNKYEYSYDANRNMILYIASYWESGTSQWQGFDKEENTYDANGNLTVNIYSYWDQFGINDWLKSYKIENTYDINGNRTVYLNNDWNSLSSQWEITDKKEYTYDIAYSLNDLYMPSWISKDYYANKPVDYISYDYDGANWTNNRKNTYYYTTLAGTSVKELSSKNYTVYPNPASDNINISFTSNSIFVTFDLYDTQGRKLISKEVTNNNQISLDGLKSGIYLYDISCDGVRKNGKLIKE